MSKEAPNKKNVSEVSYKYRRVGEKKEDLDQLINLLAQFSLASPYLSAAKNWSEHVGYRLAVLENYDFSLSTPTTSLYETWLINNKGKFGLKTIGQRTETKLQIATREYREKSHELARIATHLDSLDKGMSPIVKELDKLLQLSLKMTDTPVLIAGSQVEHTFLVPFSTHQDYRFKMVNEEKEETVVSRYPIDIPAFMDLSGYREHCIGGNREVPQLEIKITDYSTGLGSAQIYVTLRGKGEPVVLMERSILEGGLVDLPDGTKTPFYEATLNQMCAALALQIKESSLEYQISDAHGVNVVPGQLGRVFEQIAKSGGNAAKEVAVMYKFMSQNEENQAFWASRAGVEVLVDYLTSMVTYMEMPENPLYKLIHALRLGFFKNYTSFFLAFTCAALKDKTLFIKSLNNDVDPMEIVESLWKMNPDILHAGMRATPQLVDRQPVGQLTLDGSRFLASVSPRVLRPGQDIGMMEVYSLLSDSIFTGIFNSAEVIEQEKIKAGKLWGRSRELFMILSNRYQEMIIQGLEMAIEEAEKKGDGNAEDVRNAFNEYMIDGLRQEKNRLQRVWEQSVASRPNSGEVPSSTPLWRRSSAPLEDFDFEDEDIFSN